jgi:hypothetical protein
MNVKIGTAIDDDDRLNEAEKESFVLRATPTSIIVPALEFTLLELI